MIKYIEQLETNIKLYPDRAAVKSEGNRRGISYSELDTLSAKVYSYLSKNGIGKNDTVLICLPRGHKIVVSITGIIKAGAAFVVVEDTFPHDRVEYIRKDCSSKTVLDEAVYEKMMREEPLQGHADTNEHDACFAVYTSGSTGNPKGVLHEYGKIEILLEEIIYHTKPVSQGCGFAIISPFHYVVSLLQLFYSLYYGKCLWIVSYDTAKSPVDFIHLMNGERIEEAFLAPSILKIYRNQAKYLVNVFTGGEPCTDLYYENLNIINSYASSEAGMIATFRLDRKYTKPPVGKNHRGADIIIADDNGEKTADGEPGEIYIRNEFTRGYINLPEKNKEAFSDGMYHTGDIGYFNEKGDLVVSGRKDEMIKINGNRIEPAEIEAAVKNTLGITGIVAKGFNDGKRAFICVYMLQRELKEAYLLDKNGEFIFSSAEMKDKLSSVLTPYMIPAYYIVLQKFPLFENGKIKKKSLRAPRTEAFLKDYVAPHNEYEKYFCELFEKCLGIDRVGIHDDFYQIGGDSISSIELISLCKIRGINFSQIYNCRTPEKLAEFASCSTGAGQEPDERNLKARNVPHPLLPEMSDVLDYNTRMPDSTMWNLPILIKLKEYIDVGRLSKAINKVLRHHPAFSTQIDLDANFRAFQTYRPELFEEIETRFISEEELEKEKAELSYSFTVRNANFHRKNIFVTEKAAYFFLDIHHVITDGYSINLIFDQIDKCYNDENYELPTDYYYLILDESSDCISDTEYKETERYFRQHLEKLKENSYSILPKADSESTKWEYGYFEHRLSMVKQDFAVSDVARYIGRNTFFIAALALSIAAYNKTVNSAFQWIYNGRDSIEKSQSCGLLLKSLQVFSYADKSRTVEEYLLDINSQVEYMIAHNNSKISEFIGNELENTVFFLYQNDLYGASKYNFIEKAEKIPSKDPAADSFMDFEIVDNNNDSFFTCSVKYSSSHYTEDSIKKLFAIFDRTVTKLLSQSDIEKAGLREITD